MASPALADTPDLSGPNLAAYVRARAADADGKAAIAAAAYATALAGAPDNAVIAVRAYRQAFESGDFVLARRAAAALRSDGAAPADLDLLDFADAVHSRNPRVAAATVDRIAKGPFEFLAPVLRAWLAHDGGDKQAAEKLLASSENPLAKRYAAENRALLLMAEGRYDDGVAGIRALFAAGQGSLDLRIAAAEILRSKGKKDLAAGLLAGNDPTLTALREHPGKAPKPNAAFGASRLFTRLTADLGQGDPTPLSVILARLSLLLDPGNARARLLLADTLAREGSPDRALATLDDIPRDSPYAGAARRARVALLDGAGDSADALAAARALSDAGDDHDAQRYGDLLMEAGRFDEAAAAYGLAIDRVGADAGWTHYLQRGGALDRAGRWAEAKPLLEKAVELGPDQAIALNYLGYARIERREEMAGAQAMLEKAAKLRPDEPSIADSLAWAYFVRGAPAKALPLLEGAAQKKPDNVAINEHLGDAYWALGRRFEARYAWRAAAVYAEDGDATRLAAKLVSGPQPATARD
ncbi:tetratricopeptide repeat protein [soil metagenome]